MGRANYFSGKLCYNWFTDTLPGDYMQRWYWGYLLAFLVLSGLVLVGCSSENSQNSAPAPVVQRETLTQISTINALMAGVYDGDVTCGQLKKYGDFGLGTFQSLDGEMIVLDGKIYQVKVDGKVYSASDEIKAPFAAVTYFDKDWESEVASDLNFAGFQEWVDKTVPSLNQFYAIKLQGQFSHVKTRSVPSQSKPYPPLAEVTKNQAVFEFNNVSGTIVGFRCPPYVNGVNVPGYHLHFLTDDHQAGGHVLEFIPDQVTVSLDYTSEFYMILPDQDNDFYRIDLSGDQSSSIQKAEK